MSQKANRISRIYNRLRKGPVTIETIKKWVDTAGINVSERQLYRDLKEIEDSIYLEGEKVVVFAGEKNRKTWKVEYSTGEEKVSVFDVNTFYLVKNIIPLSLYEGRYEALLSFEDVVYKQFSQSPFEKNNFADDVIIKSSHFHELPYQLRHHHLLEDYIWAIQNQRKIILNKVVYDHTSLSKSTSFPATILPLFILFHRGGFFLCNLLESNNKLVVIALEQLSDFTITNEIFDASLFMDKMEEQLNKRFGVTENIDQNVYEIQIEFSENTGDFVSMNHWHTSQDFKKLSNGNWVMTLKTGINRELISWIIQWMNNATVHKPSILKKMVKKKIEDTLNLYTSEKKLSSSNDFRPLV